MPFLTSRASFASTPDYLGKRAINVVTATHSFNSELYRDNPNGEQQRIGKESWNPSDGIPQRLFCFPIGYAKDEKSNYRMAKDKRNKRMVGRLGGEPRTFRFLPFAFSQVFPYRSERTVCCFPKSDALIHCATRPSCDC